jgi:pimeloyl-ACP methyl ester carboxylesterase
MHRGYVDAPWGQIHYRETGDSAAPAVLLYPNRPRSGVIYERLAGLLADRYRVIVIDPPGFGGSDALPDDLEVPDLTRAVVVLLDALGVDRVRMSGHHTGATICLDLAATHPERVVAIAPSGTLLLTDEERAGRIDGSAFAPAAGNPPQPDGSHLQAYVGKFPPKGDEDLPFLNDVLIDNLVSEPHQMASAQAVYRYPERERMAGITAPTLFVQSIGPGEPGTLQRAESVLDLIPSSSITYIDGGDVHFIHHRASELAEVLHGFFATADTAARV